MNIKKIILEELDAFEWTNSIPSYDDGLSGEEMITYLDSRLGGTKYSIQTHSHDADGFLLNISDSSGIYIQVRFKNGKTISISDILSDLTTEPHLSDSIRNEYKHLFDTILGGVDFNFM